jgi:hypothetical protein
VAEHQRSLADLGHALLDRGQLLERLAAGDHGAGGVLTTKQRLDQVAVAFLDHVVEEAQ